MPHLECLSAILQPRKGELHVVRFDPICHLIDKLFGACAATQQTQWMVGAEVIDRMRL